MSASYLHLTANSRNSSNSSNSSSSLSSAPLPGDIDPFLPKPVSQTSVSPGTGAPHISTRQPNRSFLTQVGWTAPVLDDDDADEEEYEYQAEDDDDNSPASALASIDGAIEATEDSSDPCQILLHELSISFENFFWHPDPAHLSHLKRCIANVRGSPIRFDDLDASSLVARVLSSNGLFLYAQTSPVLKPEDVRACCTELLTCLAASGAELFDAHPRRPVYLMEAAVKHGLTDAFVSLVDAAQHQTDFSKTGGEVLVRALKNDMPLDLAFQLIDLDFKVKPDHMVDAVTDICTVILDHWQARLRDLAGHERKFATALTRLINPLVPAARVEALTKRAVQLGIRITQSELFDMLDDLMQYCEEAPNDSMHPQKLAAIIRLSGLCVDDIYTDDISLPEWSEKSGNEHLSTCLQSLRTSTEAPKKPTAIDLARKERDALLATIRAIEKSPSTVSASEYQATTEALLKRLYEQEAILAAAEHSAPHQTAAASTELTTPPQ